MRPMHATSTDETRAALDLFADAIARVEHVLLGKTREVRLAFSCLLAGGHLLLEDLPGMGKTTLTHAIANALGLNFQRIQFTSDLLPSDILGVTVFSREEQSFHFKQGPIFTQVLMADEINRSPPKTQSALLEAMGEGQVTIDGHTHSLPSPFFVIATQNPLDYAGTYPLPDSQLDRFMMCIQLGYPDRETEKSILKGTHAKLPAPARIPLTLTHIETLQNMARSIHTSTALIDYAHALIVATRNEKSIRIGLSPRAGISLIEAAKAQALLAGRDYAMPEDVQSVFLAVAAHRLVAKEDFAHGKWQLAKEILDKTAVDV